MHRTPRIAWQRTKDRLKRWWDRLDTRTAASVEQHTSIPAVGLVLGSGGLRGVAHVGVLSVLEEHGLRPEALAGSSAGSVVAALYAAGYTARRMRDVMAQLTPDLFTDITLPRLQLLVAGATALRDYLGSNRSRPMRAPGGLVKGERFSEWLRNLLHGTTFEDLSLPTYVVATDLATGEAVVFGPENAVPSLPEGYAYVTGVPVVEAIRASCSIPFIFEPVRITNRILIDGAFSDPVPARVLAWNSTQPIIAVDLATVGQADAPKNLDNSNLFQVLSQGTSLLTDRYTREILKDSADLVIRPCHNRVGLTEVAKAEWFFQQGKEAAERALLEWRREREAL